MFDNAILHLDLDAFFVSVELLRQPALQGKPLLIGGLGGRGVVASCSYEARQFGIHSAMPMRAALRLCPEAVVLRGDMEEYSRHSKLVTAVIADTAPLFEKASIDEFYVDLTGMDRYFGCWKWSRELRARIKHETGLPISAALSVNKTVSKVGTGEAKPNGELLVENGAERQFLAPLPVGKLPSVGRETERKLNLMGVYRIETLRDIPPALLEREFGKHGVSLWKKANAIDNSPVVPFHEQKSMSSERTFEQDTIDVAYLRDRLTELVVGLAYELRREQKLTACIAVKLRYTDFNTFTQQRHIPYTASDSVLIRHAHDIFERLYERRQLVRLLGVRFSDLVHGHPQASLFDDTAREASLLQQLDRIRTRFGDGAIVRGNMLRRKK